MGRIYICFSRFILYKLEKTERPAEKDAAHALILPRSCRDVQRGHLPKHL